MANQLIRRKVNNMGTVLYIKANPKNDQESRTFQISERFVKVYRETHPGDQIVTLDLYKEGIHFLTHDEVALTHTGAETEGATIRYARQFRDADKFVVAAPLWNLGSPAILKAYVDYIMIVGVTFRYTEQGPKGLCEGKKAVHITSRGGNYSEAPYAQFEMADRYLRTIFGFLGITDISTIAAEGLDVQGVDVPSIVNEAIRRAEAGAKAF